VKRSTSILKTLATIGLLAATASALAGRPLVLDDAGINKKGEGHVETWISRADGATALSISPAYAFWDSVELAALLSRDNGNSVTVTGAQAKWMITPSQANGCNFATSLGAQRVKTDFGSGNASFINGLMSCNGTGLGDVHVNVGYAKPSGGSGETSYGIALERSFGALTPHIELFGSDSLDTSVNIGLRGDIAKNVQLDGSVGRLDSVTFYTVGLKFRF
jgi:hypothetical protein